MKMKFHKNKIITSMLAGAALLFAACSEGDLPIDEIFDNETRGAVLRTVDLISGELPIGSDESSFIVELEVQSKENGTLVEFVEVYVGFRDNTPDEGQPDASRDQVLFETIDSSTFTIGEFGYPRFTYEVTVGQMNAALGLSDGEVNGGDAYEIRFEVVLEDGRRYSFDDNSATLTGSFFSSPFQYVATIVCPPRAPTPGVWTIEMQDSFGDGWQTTNGSGGPGLQVTLSSGEVFEFLICSSYEDNPNCSGGGSAGTATFTVPEGTEGFEWFFPGDFYGEISFQIFTPAGNLVADVGASTAAGPVEINYCFE
jgi:hypothetical protein